MDELERMYAALENADAAGDEEAAREIAAMIQQAQSAGPAPAQEENPFLLPGETLDTAMVDVRDYSFLEERGIDPNRDPTAVRLYDEVLDAQETGDAESERMGLIRLGGYLEGRDAIDGQAGGESAGENLASRAETGLRGFGQGVFGLGDFSAALGSWIGEGGPMSDFSLREHFAYQRNRREGMAQQNPVSSTTGYIAGAVTGGGGVAGATTKAATRAPGVVGRVAQRTFVRQPGQRGIADLGRSAAGSATASGTAAALEGGDAGEVALATGLGALAGPAGERALEGAMYAGRGLVRRFNPQAAADAAISRRLGSNGNLTAEGARQINRDLAAQGEGATILEAANPRQAAQLGEEATLSDEAFDEFGEALPDIQNRRSQRLEERIQGDVEPISTDDVRAAQEAEFQAARRMEADATADDVAAIRQEGVEAGRAQRLQDQTELNQAELGIRNAEERLRRRLTQAANNTRNNITPEALTALRKEFGDEAMGALEDAQIDIEDASNFLERPAFRAILRRYAGAADPDEAQPLVAALNRAAADAGEDVDAELLDSVFGAMDEAAEQGTGLTLSIRQLDAFRRAADAAGDADPALARGLSDVADELTEIARNEVRGYGPYLDQYAALSRRIEGATRGFQIRGAQPSRLADELRIADEAGPEFRQSLERAGQRAVADEAGRSPEQARRVAQDMVNEPDRFDMGMGARAQGARQAARAGLDEIAEAEQALSALRQRQQAAMEELRDLTRDQQRARTRQGQERIRELQDEMEARRLPMQRAEQVLNAGTQNFGRAAEMAADQGVSQTFGRIARTSLAEAAGESAEGAVDVANRLANDRGLQTRVAQALGDDVFESLQSAAQREAGSSEAVMSAARGASTNLRNMSKREAEALVSAVDLGVMATDRWSGSFGANAFLRLFRQVNGNEQRALSLARALTEGSRDEQRRTLARLAQLGASLEDQRMYARAAGAGAGIVTGQAVGGE